MIQPIDLPSDQQSGDVLAGFKCPYCGGWTKFCDSSAVYGRSYGKIYLCEPCKAWVGCHKNTGGRALGRLANKELRAWKKAAHAHFDGLWKLSRRKNRRARANRWLAGQMGLHPDVCHIGMMNVAQCREVVRICRELVASLREKQAPAETE